MADIRYLTFEGGGGKGAAYLGALELLHKELKVLEYHPDSKGIKINGVVPFRLDKTKIRGIAGTSAGAITATVLAAGYRPEDIRAMLLDSAKLSEIVRDYAGHGQIPAIVARSGAGGLEIKPLAMKEHLSHRTQEGLKASAWFTVANRSKDMFAAGICYGLGLPGVFAEAALAESLSQFTEAARHYYFDLGLLDGEVLRQIIGNVLQTQFGNRNITFKEMNKDTEIHLKLTGTSVQTAETVWFDHLGVWANMCVADAVRISVSFPMVFKPVCVLPRDQFRNGTSDGYLFADGGILANNPIRAFDYVKKPEPIGLCESFITGRPRERRAPGRLNPEVLSFRLDKDVADPGYIGLPSYMLGLTKCATSLSETTPLADPQALRQTIALSTEGLSTLDFVISPGTPEDPNAKPGDKLDAFVRRAEVETRDGLAAAGYFRVEPV